MPDFNWRACRHKQHVHLRLGDVERRVHSNLEWLCKIMMAKRPDAGLAHNKCLEDKCPYTDRDDVP